MNEEDIPATPFNFAMIYYVNLNNRLVVRDDAYMNNDIYGYYKSLNRIYNMIYFVVLDGDEKRNKEDKTKWDTTELDSYFKEAKENLEQRKAKKDTMEVLRKIDRKIMVLMNKYKMIFPNIESTYGVSKLYDKYKLNKGTKDGSS